MDQLKNIKVLNLPEYEFRFKKLDEKDFIFDVVRKKFVVLTPEEWVRLNFIQYLIIEKKYPASLMAVEKKVMVNSQPQRFDLLVYDKKGLPFTIAEFKSPDVKITQQTFDQVVRYNMSLKVKYIIVSNGLDHFVCEINYQKNSYAFLKEVPFFQE
ncbi:MAG: type I restriction enzyme HsdR N-terminal domain-containing protein [Prolixibacteraceae bacterium]|nr:type I restriction enzyme HsdR N-terminal domain-containing protein [Prolixibacteraceae bacterium]MBN2775494.1 type I restriction enzyme HsdR N-terminal domain-containing protein [Prolixibacteraceae bacterium]